jgi:plastocyanin
VGLTFLPVGSDDPAPAGEPVRVEGVVTNDGKRPDPVPVTEAGTVRHLIEVDPGTRGLKDAVVWLEGVPGGAETRREQAGEPVVVDQQNFFFVPHVVSVRSGQPVEFRNSDAANHGVRASSLDPRNEFNVTTPTGGHFTHRFLAAKYPVALGCPIHAAMAGWVYVFDHRFHAVTDATGQFRLPPVPPGRYRLRVHHADGGLRKAEPVAAGGGKTVRLRIEFHDGDRKAAR